jgi:dihydroorotate dehydrogenase (fumarate)
MKDLSIKYMGLTLKNPIIAGSCGLTSTVEQIIKLEEAGAGAVVMKSLFEEQISMDVNSVLYTNIDNYNYPEAEDYIRNYTKMNSVQQYIDTIKKAKAAVQIPVIASINCTTASDWTNFATSIEQAGADALELNIYEMAADKNKPSEQFEQQYIDILRLVKQKVHIPIAVKIGSNFSNIVRMVDQLYANGADSVVMFNRLYSPDFDLDTLQFISSDVLSNNSDIKNVLRWMAVVSGKLPVSQLVATTGIHNGSDVIKQLLAGASAVQIVSVLYKNGLGTIANMLSFIEDFMDEWDFKTIDEFKGRMNYKNVESPEIYERTQFMKYFSSKK